MPAGTHGSRPKHLHAWDMVDACGTWSILSTRQHSVGAAALQTAKIPMEAIQGFRSPFLVFTPEQRRILNANGFRYDASISETFPTQTSPSRNEMLWPYTMDYGIPQDCSISTGVCTADERHPGLWEFPLWSIQDSNGVVLASMDPQVRGWGGGVVVLLGVWHCTCYLAHHFQCWMARALAVCSPRTAWGMRERRAALRWRRVSRWCRVVAQ